MSCGWVGGGGGIPRDYLVSTQIQLWLFCCWGCGCCWAVTIRVVYHYFSVLPIPTSTFKAYHCKVLSISQPQLKLSLAQLSPSLFFILSDLHSVSLFAFCRICILSYLYCFFLFCHFWILSFPELFFDRIVKYQGIGQKLFNPKEITEKNLWQRWNKPVVNFSLRPMVSTCLCGLQAHKFNTKSVFIIHDDAR